MLEASWKHDEDSVWIMYHTTIDLIQWQQFCRSGYLDRVDSLQDRKYYVDRFQSGYLDRVDSLQDRKYYVDRFQ